MFQTLKKTYQLPVLNQTAEYKQATMKECLEFSYEMKQEGFILEDWIYNFLKDKITIRKKDLLLIDLQKFMETLFETRFKGFFSKKKGGTSYPFEAYLMLISKAMSIDPETMISRYTPEQISFYTDGEVYNLNEQSKEGQKKNRMNKAMKEMRAESSVEDDLKEIKEMEEKLKSKK